MRRARASRIQGDDLASRRDEISTGRNKKREVASGRFGLGGKSLEMQVESIGGG